MAKRLSKNERELQAYQLAIGKVVMAWAELEAKIGQWFAPITGMKRDMADAIFYSGRNFATRADMAEASLKVSKLDQKSVNLVKTLLKVSRRYSSFRNAIAHDQHFNLHGDQIYTTSGSDWFSSLMEGRAYTIKDIEQAAINIERLTYLASGPDLWKEDAEGWEERHCEQIRQLPKDAHSREPTLIRAVQRPMPKRSK